MSLSKKMLRDIKINKTQFISILLMAFLGVFAFCGVCSEYYGLEQTSSEFYRDTNLADGWIYNTTITDEAVDKISNFSTNHEKQLVVQSVGIFLCKRLVIMEIGIYPDCPRSDRSEGDADQKEKSRDPDQWLTFHLSTS